MNNVKKKIWYMFLLSGVILTVAACGGGPDEPVVATADFIAMAKVAECSEIHNRLFLIDQKNVFWDVAGNCPGRSPVQKFFGKTPSDLLCSQTTMPVGAITVCNDNSAREMFSTMSNNLDKADLGLGTSHQVQPIAF